MAHDATTGIGARPAIGVVVVGPVPFPVSASPISQLTGSHIDDWIKSLTPSTFLSAWFWFCISLSAALPMTLLVGSIAVLESKSYGRKLLLIYAAANVILGLATNLATKLAVWPILVKHFWESPGPHINACPDQQFLNELMWLAFAFNVIWGALIHFVMTQEKVIVYLSLAASDNAGLYRP